MEHAACLPSPPLPAPPRALALHRSRRGLTQLDAHMLRDIGLTEAEARVEAARPLWDAPEHWQKR